MGSRMENAATEGGGELTEKGPMKTHFQIKKRGASEGQEETFDSKHGGQHASSWTCTPHQLGSNQPPALMWTTGSVDSPSSVRQPFSRPIAGYPALWVIGLASTVVPTGTEYHRRVPRTSSRH